MGLDKEKVKKAKKEKKEGTKPRKKTAWKVKQLGRTEKTMKTLGKLAGLIAAGKPTGVDASLAQNAVVAVSTLHTQLTMLPDDWKPAKGSSPGTTKKIGIGSVIMVKTDLSYDEVKLFKHVPKETFANATVIDDDHRNWLIRCTDNIVRTISKKMVQKVPDAAAKPAEAASA